MEKNSMNDLKTDFRNWLIEQDVKERTVVTYLRRVQKLSKDTNWDFLTVNAIPLLAEYLEYANKEYFLDRITIWRALEYFDKISDIIYANSTLTSSNRVKLYLFDGKEDHFVCDTSLMLLYDDIWLINRYLYESEDKLEIKYNSNIDTMKLNMLLLKLKNDVQEELKNLAIHIVYDKKGVQDNKIAITKYCNFLYSKPQTPQYKSKFDEAVDLTRNINPNKTIDGNYKETRPITGKYPRQVTAYFRQHRERSDTDDVFTIKDLSQIFYIDSKTAINLMERFRATYTETVLRCYYSVKATNACLEKYHHYKIENEYAEVDYLLGGPDYWCTRKEALVILGIRRSVFHAHIAQNNPYINYAEKAPKYYKPVLEYLSNTDTIKKLSKRKYNKNKTL